MSTRFTPLRLTLAILVAMALAPPATAITDEEIFRDFRFNFANPGARALAMGGAFIAIANDATAAQANPSRLAVLRRPEVFAEIRNRDTEPTRRDTGRFFLDPSGVKNPAASMILDASVEPETQTIPSVVSFVWPFKLRRALTVGISRQELLAVESNSANTYDLTPDTSSLFQDPNNPDEIVVTSASGFIDASMVLYNLSAGYQVTRDLFVGGSAIFGQLDLQSEQRSFLADPDQLTQVGQVDPRFQSPTPVPFRTTTIDDTDNAFAWSFGLFWKLNDFLSFGTVYKKGSEMAVEETVTDFLGGASRRLEDVTFNVPDVEGFGVSYRPWAKASGKAQNVLFAMDVVRVENKDLVEGFTSQLNILTDESLIRSIEFTADTQTEIHLGAEYYMTLGRATLALRGGVFTDPDNSVHTAGVGRDVTGGARKAIVDGDAFPARDDETHFTGGFGFSYANFEVGAAADFSDIETQGLFSVIYRFKR